MKTPLLAVAAAAVVLLGACATNRAQPLTPERVETALAPPSLDAVRVAADQLHHPLLPALKIDGRDGFTPDEIAVIAVVASPRLRAVRDQRGVAHAQVVQAGILPNPQLEWSLDQPHGNSDPTLVTGSAFGLAGELTALLGRGDRIGAAEQSARSLDLDIAWQEWQVAQDARLRAFRVLSEEERLPLARAIEDDLAANVALLRQALAHGLTTTTELTTATATWTQAESDRLALEQALVADRAALRLTLGLPPEAPLLLRTVPLPVWPPESTTAATLLDGLEHRRVDLVAFAIGYESEEANLRAAVRAQFPKIGLSLGKATDTSDVHSRTFGVTVDLPLFDRGQGAIAAAEATRQQLFDEYVARVAEARSEVTLILANLALVRAQLTDVSTSLPEFENHATLVDRSYASHHASAFAWREARGARNARRIAQSELTEDALELTVALEVATGRSSLAGPPVPTSP